MTIENSAFIFIGYQNDYFADDGILRSAIEESSDTNRVLENTMKLIATLKDTQATLIQTPIIFTQSYEELNEPVGILKVIKDVGAFQEGQKGSDIIAEFDAYGDRIATIKGKRGLNAFSNTDLHEKLKNDGIQNIYVAGAVTSICIDSTARAAHERGYNVFVLSDCTAGRSNFEQKFYCENIFPLYAQVIDSQTIGAVDT